MTSTKFNTINGFFNRIPSTRLAGWALLICMVLGLIQPVLAQEANPPQPSEPQDTYTVFLTSLLNGNSVLPPVSGGPEWPMVAGNPQRTSYTSSEVTGTPRLIWYRPIEAYIPQHVQIIAAEGLLYLSTSAGLYALHPGNGATVWRFDTAMPLGNSPTVHNDVVYVGGMDRKLYALNASTGQKLWSYDGAGAGYSANPMVVNGMVIVGNRDGYLYAIGAHGTANQGRLVWRFNAGAPIIQSAAQADSSIFFVANDNYAYAININNGQQQWKSAKLPGEGYISYWPVVFREFVVFAAASPYRNGMDPGTSTIKDANGNGYGGVFDMERDELFPNMPDGSYIGQNLGVQSWSQGNPVYDVSRINDYFEAKPWRAAMTVLYRSNGSEYTFDSDGDGRQERIPIAQWGTRSGNRYPPLVGPDNNLYASNVWQRFYIPQGRVMGWNPQYPDKMIVTQGQGAVDEPQAISAGGGSIYRNLCCDRVGDFFNMSAPSRNTALWNYANTLYAQAPNYDSMWYGTVPGDPVRLHGNYGNANGLYHNHGDQNPLVPYANGIYAHRSNAVVAYGSTTQYGAQPLLTINAVNDNTLPVPTPADLRARLDSEVLKIIQAGRLRPGYYNAGQFLLFDLPHYFENPGDTLLALSLAYPHVSASVQSQLRTYLQAYFNDYFNPTMYARTGWAEGVGREGMIMPPDLTATIANMPRSQSPGPAWTWTYPQHNFYAMWKYASIVSEHASTAYNLAKSKLIVPTQTSNEILLDRPWELNGWIAGYTGFLRLQEAANMTGTDASLRTQVTNELNRLQALRTNNFQKDTEWNEDNFYHRRVLNVARNFIFLTPELGSYLRSNANGVVSNALAEYEDVAPYWFMMRQNAVVNEGVVQNLWDVHALFMAKAHFSNLPYDQLVRYLDAPAFERGDLFYIQNLATLLARAP